MIDYIRDGQEIYRNSFRIIREEARLERIPADLEKLAVRVIHACGMVDAIDGLQFSPGAGKAGRDALAAGAPILCDARMVAEGITRARLPANNPVICTLHDKDVPQLARELGNTRSAVALEHWREHLEGSLKRLLEETNQVLDKHEQLNGLVLVPEVWAVDNGFLTPTLKIKRASVESAYGPHFSTWGERREGVLWHQ